MKKTLLLFFAFFFLAGLKPLEINAANSLAEKFKGKILLEVESHGEAWYVSPSNYKRYYLGRPDDAFIVMRKLGLGITERDYFSFEKKAPSRLAGRILIRAERRGEAYYVNPSDLKLYYLGSPKEAFRLMRSMGHGIVTSKLEEIARAKEEPMIEARDQVFVNGTVEIKNIICDGRGWVAVYNDYDGEPGDVLGYADLVDGENPFVRVYIGDQAANRYFHAVLHFDHDSFGKFEYPDGDDFPVISNGKKISAKFFVK